MRQIPRKTAYIHFGKSIEKMETGQLNASHDVEHEAVNSVNQSDGRSLGPTCKQIPFTVHAEFLQAAFDEAETAITECEVPVGCVFVKYNDISNLTLDGSSSRNNLKIISRGRNSVNATKNATRHAEMNCIDKIHFNVLKGNY